MSEVAVECEMRYDIFADALKETTVPQRKLMTCSETQSRPDCVVNWHHRRNHQLLGNTVRCQRRFWQCFFINASATKKICNLTKNTFYPAEISNNLINMRQRWQQFLNQWNPKVWIHKWTVNIAGQTKLWAFDKSTYNHQ